MTEDMSRAKVLEVYDDACEVGWTSGRSAIFSKLAQQEKGSGYLGYSESLWTESSTRANAEAWLDAASRLKAEPVEERICPHVGEGQMCTICNPPVEAEGGGVGQLRCEVCSRPLVDGVCREFGTLHANSKVEPKEAAPEVAESQSEIDRLRALAAAMYQFAGAHRAPLKWMDVLSAAAEGEAFEPEGLLPYEMDGSEWGKPE